jgi:hypothetical protein
VRPGRASPGRARGAVAGPTAPLRGAVLIMYGLIRQWAGSESECEVGEAGDGASCAGGGEVFASCDGGRVADSGNSRGSGGLHSLSRCGDDGAAVRRGAESADGFFE